MSDLELNNPVSFFVSSFTPVEFYEKRTLTISGFDLKEVSRAFIKEPKGNEHDAVISSRGADTLQVEIPIESMPENSMFFVVLVGDDNSWYPVGPLMRPSRSPSPS